MGTYPFYTLFQCVRVACWLKVSLFLSFLEHSHRLPVLPEPAYEWIIHTLIKALIKGCHPVHFCQFKLCMIRPLM